jgi:hypothetical protein
VCASDKMATVAPSSSNSCAIVSPDPGGDARNQGRLVLDVLVHALFLTFLSIPYATRDVSTVRIRFTDSQRNAILLLMSEDASRLTDERRDRAPADYRVSPRRRDRRCPDEGRTGVRWLENCSSASFIGRLTPPPPDSRRTSPAPTRGWSPNPCGPCPIPERSTRTTRRVAGSCWSPIRRALRG